MIQWSEFNYFAWPILLCWLLAVFFQYVIRRKDLVVGFALTGILIHAAFILLLGIGLERPPFRTMGETRLWYVFFLSLVGTAMYLKWKFPWILTYSLVVASVFLLVNLLKPEIHSKTLMPALQSPWFVPHVTVYMLSYAFLSAAAIAAVVQLTTRKRDVSSPDRMDEQVSSQHLVTRTGKSVQSPDLATLTDHLVTIGSGLFMVGLLMGAIWAKEAWGHYWSWDPKETWAFATISAYMLYLHLRYREDRPKRLPLWLLLLGFVLLMITWKGVNYLPAAQNSIHVYQNA